MVRQRCIAQILLLSAFILLPLSANELSVDKRSLQIDESLTITVTVENEFTTVDSIRVPLKNLAFDGAPSVSSEFQWINGATTRRKVFTYSAHALAAGTAVVGPITLRGGGNEVETLAPVTIQVIADVAAGSNDPAKILNELIATGRDPICLIAEVDKNTPFVGEEIVVTWTLYNATSVRQYAIGDVPKLEDFWTEELDVRGEPQQQIVLGHMFVQKVPIRRAALFPLRSGPLIVGPMGVSASILKRIDGRSPYGSYEAMEIDVHRRSAALTIHAKPVPPGPPVAAVGDSMTMRCSTPVQRNGGPIALDVTLGGRGNLRSASPPAFERAPDGSVQIVEKKLDVQRVRNIRAATGDAWMSREWQYLIFPARAGQFQLPAVKSTVLSSDGQRIDLQCNAATLMVQAATPSEPPPRLAARVPPISKPAIGLWLIAVIAISALIAITAVRMQRSQRIRSAVRRLMRPTPAETRSAVDDFLHQRGVEPAALMREASDRGDAYRSLRSLLDALERDRVIAGDREVAERIRELVTA
jgi:hypothetical protein